MSAFTFTDAHISDLEYELNDSELYNDVLAIVGAAGAEQLVRGYDAATSIPKYGRRSMRLPVPVGASAAMVQGLVSNALDRYSVPAPNVRMLIIGDTAVKIGQILIRQVSDKVTVQLSAMSLNQDFIIDGITARQDVRDGILSAEYQLTGLRAGE